MKWEDGTQRGWQVIPEGETGWNGYFQSTSTGAYVPSPETFGWG